MVSNDNAVKYCCLCGQKTDDRHHTVWNVDLDEEPFSSANVTCNRSGKNGEDYSVIRDKMFDFSGRYCPDCGSKLLEDVDDASFLICTNCHFSYEVRRIGHD